MIYTSRFDNVGERIDLPVKQLRNSATDILKKIGKDNPLLNVNDCIDKIGNGSRKKRIKRKSSELERI